MTPLNMSSIETLPTIRQLSRATLFAAAAAAVILVTTVLPAEYGVDPTGVDGAFCLTAMGLTKQGAASATPRADAPVTSVLADGSTEICILLKGYHGKETMATMKAGMDGQALFG